MTGIQSHDPDYAFFEIVKVGRNWLLHADVTIVYVSQKQGTYAFSRRYAIRFC